MTDRTDEKLSTTRRGFLRLVSASASFAALARLRALPAAAQIHTAAGASARFFDDTSREILGQIVARMVDTGEASAPAVDDTGTIATIDALCAGLDPALVESLPLALRLVEYGPFVFDWRLTRFTQLSPAEQDAALSGWMTSRFTVRRLAFFALRNLALLGYYSQPETWPLVDYRGPLLHSAGAPS
jgi:hypothetical protein